MITGVKGTSWERGVAFSRPGWAPKAAGLWSGVCWKPSPRIFPGHTLPLLVPDVSFFCLPVSRFHTSSTVNPAGSLHFHPKLSHPKVSPLQVSHPKLSHSKVSSLQVFHLILSWFSQCPVQYFSEWMLLGANILFFFNSVLVFMDLQVFLKNFQKYFLIFFAFCCFTKGFFY